MFLSPWPDSFQKLTNCVQKRELRSDADLEQRPHFRPIPYPTFLARALNLSPLSWNFWPSLRRPSSWFARSLQQTPKKTSTLLGPLEEGVHYYCAFPTVKCVSPPVGGTTKACVCVCVCARAQVYKFLWFSFLARGPFFFYFSRLTGGLSFGVASALGRGSSLWNQHVREEDERKEGGRPLVLFGAIAQCNVTSLTGVEELLCLRRMCAVLFEILFHWMCYIEKN